jgi:hypothetical protein
MSRFLAGLRGAVSVTYGATADLGETDDPLVDATAYSAGTVYAEGALVSSAGSYYYSRSAGNVGNLLSNNTYWFPISNFVYVDATSGSDANTYNSNPTTAFGAPVQTLDRVQDLLHTGGSPNVVNAPAKTMVLLKRGDIYVGALTIKVECIIGAWGTRASARPEIQFGFSSNTGLSFTGNTIEVQSPGTGTIVRNLRINPRFTTHYGFTAGTGTMADGDRIWKQSDHTMLGTVRGALNSNRITIQWDTPSDGGVTVSSVVFEKQDGTKTFTMAASTNRTVVSGYAAQTTDCRIINCEVFNASGNGVGSGTTNVRNSASNFYVYNCSIHDTIQYGGAGAGMQGGWGTNIKILHCTAYNNGTNGSIFNHNFYLDDLDNCEFAYNWCYMTGAYGNHALVVHGQCDAGWVHDNLLEKSQAGLGINDGYSTIAASGWYEEFSNWVVERNIIRDCGLYNGNGLILDIRANTNCVYRNNICYNNKGNISIAENNHTADKAYTTNLIMEYNTFISDTTIASGDYFVKIDVGIQGIAPTGTIIRNNIFESRKTNLATFSTSASIGVNDCSFINNLLYNTTGYTSVIRWHGVAYTLSNWAATGSINSNSTNATTASYASVFTNIGTFDLTLPGGSPAKAIGVYVPTALRDFRQIARSVTTPSSGAYE